MICRTCGGEVIWMGSFSALTHTECQVCGARNSQVAQEEHECETCEGEGTIDERLGGEWNSNPEATCPDCDGKGYWVTPNAEVTRG